MSAHEGVSCDACGRGNFRSKRYKCLICYDYDLCSNCYERGETSSHHTSEHPMQCILTRQDFDLYYHGERYTSEQAQSYTCPFCGEMGFAYPFQTDLSSSTQSLDIFHHLQLKHVDEQQSSEVICPICASMANGEPNLVTGDLLSHVANDHQHQQVQTPSTAGIGQPNPYTRQSSSSSRDFDFTTSTSTRAGFRRGPVRTPSRRGGLGRGGGTVSQHFVVDTSAVNGGSDPIADLLTQLSTVRRLAAANNNNSSSSSSSNTINLQTLTRQQYERERLRTAGRSQQPQSQQSTASPSSVLPSTETDLFDSLFASALFIDPISSSSSNHQTWAQVVAQQQQQQQQQSASEPPIATKTMLNEPDQSLLRKLCEESPSTSLVQQQKRKNDFVHSLLLASFVCPLNDNDK